APGPAPAGRPEEEWRKAEREAPEAEPPAGSQTAGSPLRQYLDYIGATQGAAAAEAAARAVALAMDLLGDSRQSAQDEAMNDTHVPTVGRGGEGAPPDG